MSAGHSFCNARERIAIRVRCKFVFLAFSLKKLTPGNLAYKVPGSLH